MFILANVRLDTGRIPTKKFLRGVSVTDLSFGPGFWCQGTAEQGSGMGHALGIFHRWKGECKHLLKCRRKSTLTNFFSLTFLAVNM